MSCRRSAEAGLVTLLLCASGSIASGQKYNFAKIVDTSGGFVALSPNVSLNDAGTVTFTGVQSSGLRGVFAASGATLTAVAESSPPNTEAYFSEPVINNGGTVAFVRTQAGQTAVLSVSAGRTATIADVSGQFLSVGPPLSLNNGGTVVFAAELVDRDVGVFAGTAGQVETIARASGFGSTLSTISHVTVNDNGTIAFVDARPHEGRIFLVANGTIATISMGNDLGAFTTHSGLALNSRGDLAFTSQRVGSPVSTAFVRIGTETRRFAEARSALDPINPDALSFGAFRAPAINDQGTVAFAASVPGGSGIFTGPDPVVDKVIVKGDALFGSSVVDIGPGPNLTASKDRYLNNRGQIAFSYTLASGVSGIAVATPVASQDPPPNLPANAIVNAASFAGPNQTGYVMAPGSVVSLFGSGFASRLSVPSTPVLPITLDGVSVTFNGIPAPLFFVAPGQINAQLPFELPEGTVEAKIRTPAGESAGRTLQIAPVAPALYTFNQQGSGQAIVVFANSTTLAAPAGLAPGSRPAQAGDVLTLFANGLGAVDPPIANGVNSCGTNGVCATDFSNVVLRRTVSTPTIEIGGVAVPAANITFSGLAPQFVALYQINIELPPGIAAGNAVPIVIRQGSASSRPDVTIAIQ